MAQDDQTNAKRQEALDYHEFPRPGKLEIRATAQDGSGQTSAFLGQGMLMAAPDVPRPDKIVMMKSMAKMKMKIVNWQIYFH